MQRLEDLPGHQAEQGVLAAEVIEEGRLRHVRAVGDLVHGGRLEALLREELPGRVEDPSPDLELAALAAAERGGGMQGGGR